MDAGSGGSSHGDLTVTSQQDYASRRLPGPPGLTPAGLHSTRPGGQASPGQSHTTSAALVNGGVRAAPRPAPPVRGAVHSRDPCHSHFGARHKLKLEATAQCAGTAAAAEPAMLVAETTLYHQAVNSSTDWGSAQLAMITLSTILVDVFSDIIYASS